MELIVGAVCIGGGIALFVILAMLAGKKEKSDAEQERQAVERSASRATGCPKCKRGVTVSDIACSNCETVGAIREVGQKVSYYKTYYWTCRACNCYPALNCPDCKTNLIGLFPNTVDTPRRSAGL
ncbi:hypothetical protein ACFXHA_17700 [Nocardia sp. NPDC059240]|uniref:hypothetical protein n=1 Tax=Nocardia sp. NPDC059240 TaxID=3346786 RepID=UPI00369695B3